MRIDRAMQRHTVIAYQSPDFLFNNAVRGTSISAFFLLNSARQHDPRVPRSPSAPPQDQRYAMSLIHLLPTERIPVNVTAIITETQVEAISPTLNADNAAMKAPSR
tara:strand:+ start:2275 stop:2592 length:318 start_codon:yes stop_codon:yes gene_type:complete